MNIVITGAAGFIGLHMMERAGRGKRHNVVGLDRAGFDDDAALSRALSQAEAVIHLAAVNRGEDERVYGQNIAITRRLVDALDKAGVKPRLVFASSIQQEMDNPYGRSKSDSARILTEWADRTGALLSVLLIPNVFGGRCKPFYNSVVATFCHQLINGANPEVLTDREVEFIYVNALTDILLERAEAPQAGLRQIRVPGDFKMTVSALLSLLKSFHACYFGARRIPALPDAFHRNLYATFLSYLPAQALRHDFEPKTDPRGSLFEIVKQTGCGQLFFSVTKPGALRGNHYHTRKLERFCVLSGEALIRMRGIGSAEVREYHITGPCSVEMPVFFTHNIKNVGDSDLLTLFWAGEIFDPSDADTFFEEV